MRIDIRRLNLSQGSLSPGFSPLFFANADNFRKSVIEMVEKDRPHSVVIDLDSVNMMDMDGEKMLSKFCKELRKKNVQVVLVRVGRHILELLRKTGTLEEIGSQNIYETVRMAVFEAQKANR